MPLTPEQQAAVQAKGNVLLMAGAGTGKTSTLVERCLHWLFHAEPPGSLDRLLMVTFTEAAAAEMRNRIREALLERSHHPELAQAAARQLALLDTAHIRTLHSFCLELIHRHFWELEVDPRPMVLDPAQARLLQEDILDRLFEKHYANSRQDAPQAVCQWIRTLGGTYETPARELLLGLYQQIRVIPNYQLWLDQQRNCFSQAQPDGWRKALEEGGNWWRARWLPYLQNLADELFEPKTSKEAIAYAQGFAACLRPAENSLDLFQLAQALREVSQRNETSGWPKNMASRGRKPLNKFLEEAHSLLAYFPPSDAGGAAANATAADPLEEDWTLVRPFMLTLLDLLAEFDGAYSRAKRAQGALDFNDFEQLALRLLYQRPSGNLSETARYWQQQFDLVFVDEYQDINPAQDAILRALARDGAAANRFLVGDIKQSIYRFRQAAPEIFRCYAGDWKNKQPHSQVLPLCQNFRSHESLLQFFNDLFGFLMGAGVDGVRYDAEARLHFGAPQERAGLTRAADPPELRRVELRLLQTDDEAEQDNGEESAADAQDGGPMEELSALREEARRLGRRLRELKEQGFLVWRRQSRKFTPVQWRDMAVLLRAPKGRSETFVYEFQQLGIPIRTKREGLLDCQEVADLHNLLRLLDNPRQDLPLLAVLRSPLVGLKLDDLARIRLALLKGPLWLALQRWNQTQEGAAEANPAGTMVRQFLENYQRWRRLARQGSLVGCLETILRDTLFDEWCRAQSNGQERHANLQQFLHWARHFDALQRQGLHRFLNFLEQHQRLELTSDSPPATAEDCVTLLSIHQSKGLEFPVVAVAALGTGWNQRDLADAVLVDDKWGLCPKVFPAPPRPPYPSVVHWLRARQHRLENLGEELRLLYVALTRACDLLLLSGAATTQAMDRWRQMARLPDRFTAILQARSPLDWLGAWWLRTVPSEPFPPEADGCNDFLRWSTARLAGESGPPVGTAQDATAPPAPALSELPKPPNFLDWRYPFCAATREPAKTSVSLVRQRLRQEEQTAEAARPFFLPPPPLRPARASNNEDSLSIGTAHHHFLQHLDLAAAGSLEGLQRECQRLQSQGLLTDQEAAMLDLQAVAGFWDSPVGRNIRAHPGAVFRELPFTARFTPADWQRLQFQIGRELPGDEFVVVQGVADLVVRLPDELWLLDYKTDRIGPEELPSRLNLYQPQVQIYALALSRIFRRPVRRLWLHFFTLGQTLEVPPPA